MSQDNLNDPGVSPGMFDLDGKNESDIPDPPENEEDEGIATDDDTEVIGGEIDDDKNCEEVHSRGVCLPCEPTAKMVEDHNRTGHFPFRSWCPICVQARAVEDPHTIRIMGPMKVKSP